MHFREGEFDSQCCEKQSFICAENVKRHLKGVSFQQNELFHFFRRVLHRKGCLSCFLFLAIEGFSFIAMVSWAFKVFTQHRQGFYVIHSKVLRLNQWNWFSPHSKGCPSMQPRVFFLALNRFSVPSSYIRRVLLLQCDALAMFLNNFSC